MAQRTLTMRPPEQHNHHGYSSTNRVPSSSTSRSSPSCTSSTLTPNPKRRTMEEVWKDISLCSLHHHHHHHHHQEQRHQRRSPAASRSLRTMIFQDFLAGSLNRHQAEPLAAPAEDLPPPPTALTLTPSMEIQFMEADAHANSNSNSSSTGAYNAASFISPAFSNNVAGSLSPIGLFSFCSKKEMASPNPAEPGDRRHKRMIKNRESAARSRARKQAYINELELEVTHLMQENSRLNKELEELGVAMAAKNTRRNILQRSSTAPF